MREKNGLYFMGLLALLTGSLLGVAGVFGLLKGSATRSIGGTYAFVLFMGGVVFVMGLAFLGRGHVEPVLRFCNRCGEIVPEVAVACPECGHDLPAF
ncbi:MAG TPA: zinc-ribbon domain-containing protein [Nocardioidaceae bacterium]|nr:zinc-ribbon domain-containing protein [Nocardioidaceae bacterium]